MIAEMIHYAASYFATPKDFRQHLKGAVGLWARGKRCRKAWTEHEENAKKFIAAEVAKLKMRRTCVVLGSGLLRDVPIELLAKTFDTVVLIDIAHLKSARMKVARLKQSRNVKFIYRDVAEINRWMDGETFEPMAFLRDVPFLDLVISANLLSQIGIAAEEALEATNRADEVETLVPQIIKGHLDRLSSLPCKALLLTDISFVAINRHGEFVADHDLMFGVETPKPDAMWIWQVAPMGEISKDYSTNHTVIAKVMR
jgi:hypothetical protein